ncbi:b3b5f76b-8582-409c-a23d-ebb554fc2673 [Thermothielavioides terrestris]|uniref:B3b5f76b-8582-409c-a23d-ebb554fc2673 n=1 Tax=Thermothielavioides terrestris TaxID=2587410 RepID=A0A3S4ARW7_9PEZI|nr:b3b5f76b-8582-409c-a23d-ebb554fc2673 [Thermothielavioides terrestris]
MSPEKAKTEIPNPRRILAVSLTDSAQHLSEVLKDLTGTHPTPALPPPPLTPSPPSPSSPPAPSSSTEDPPPAPSLAGTTHLLPLRTPYYAASVPVWLDLVASPAEWAASFLSAEAREVLEVLGGVLVVMGMARVLEALEANDWSGGGMKRGDEEEVDDGEEAAKSTEGKSRQGQDGDDDYEFDPESLDFGFDREDFAGLREAILAGGGGGIGEGSNAGAEEQEEVGEEDVEKLERMMLKLQAVRDASAGLPEEQRRRMAARAVGEVMKEL